jgi:hypothetical protein
MSPPALSRSRLYRDVTGRVERAGGAGGEAVEGELSGADDGSTGVGLGALHGDLADADLLHDTGGVCIEVADRPAVGAREELGVDDEGGAVLDVALHGLGLRLEDPRLDDRAPGIAHDVVEEELGVALLAEAAKLVRYASGRHAVDVRDLGRHADVGQRFEDQGAVDSDRAGALVDVDESDLDVVVGVGVVVADEVLAHCLGLNREPRRRGAVHGEVDACFQRARSVAVRRKDRDGRWHGAGW